MDEFNLEARHAGSDRDVTRAPQTPQELLNIPQVDISEQIYALNKARAGVVFFAFLLAVLSLSLGPIIVIECRSLTFSTGQVGTVCFLENYNISNSVYNYTVGDRTIRFVYPSSPQDSELRECWYSVGNPENHSFAQNQTSTIQEVVGTVLMIFVIVLSLVMLLKSLLDFRRAERILAGAG